MQNMKQLANYGALSFIIAEIKLPFRHCHKIRGSRCSFVLQTSNNKDMYFLEVPFSISITLLNSIAICVLYFRINVLRGGLLVWILYSAKEEKVWVFRVRCQLEYLGFSKLHAFLKNTYLLVTNYLPLSDVHRAGEYTAWENKTETIYSLFYRFLLPFLTISRGFPCHICQ